MRYLYSNPQTTYSELVVAARRAESEMKETKVKARSAATTEVPSGSKELGDQIVRLMAALTRAEQSTRFASAPSSPRHRGCGRGWTDRHTSVCPNSHNGWTGLGQTSTHSSSIVNKSSAESPCKGNQNTCRPAYKVVCRVPKAPVLFNAIGVRAGATWQENAQLLQCS